jgi:hypothetical protein
MTKKLFLFAMLFIMGFSNFAQSLNSPESIVYDAIGNRYIISNINANTILQQSDDGTLTDFVCEG